MEQNERPLSTADNTRYKVISEEKEKYRIPRLYWLASLGIVAAIWQVAAYYTASELLLPNPYVTLQALIQAICDPEILVNLAITMRRVLTGFAYAALIGIPLGYMMGYSTVAMRMLDPLISSLRQVPIMAWVPLTIVWFGLGDGPTIFLITFAGVFPVILNTIAGVQSISQDYYHAARSMGARPWSILSSIIVPGSLPDILTGLRIALSAGWMSVI
ncbi:MAG: ABC transporter permease [Syntrophomonadaceae bacterium]|jgi:ABC-type nitrate/sulfonate/bicarbonate transport system permease component|nr:ABC transporter permease [Syntrophomonadaceae bacterium]